MGVYWILLLVAATNVFLAAKVVAASPNKLLNRLFAACALIMTVWMVVVASEDAIPFGHTTLVLVRFDYALSMFLAVSILLFAQQFPVEIRWHRSLTRVLTSLGLASSGLSLSTLQIVALRHKGDTFDIIYGGIPNIIWIVSLGAVLVAGFLILFLQYLRSDSENKQKMKLFILGLVLCIGTLVVFFLILPSLAGGDQGWIFKDLPYIGVASNFGLLGVLFFTSGTAYAILRHQLFDIRVVIKRIFLYTLLLGFVFGIYSVVIQTLSGWLPISRNVADLVAALLVAFSFDPVRRAISRWTERYLFVSEYKADDVIKLLSDQLTSVVDLDEALRLVVKIITTEVKLNRGAAVVIRKGDDDKTELHVSANAALPAPTRLVEEGMLPLVQYLETTPGAILTAQLAQRVEEDQLSPSAIRRFVFRNGKPPDPRVIGLRRQSLEKLQNLKLGAALPVVVNKKLICILLFGEKLSGDIFFTEDVKFLQLVASTTGNAIEKARFYEEDQIKSEFVSIASHELLTPTAAIEGYLSMILVEKMGKVDKQAEQYLQVVYKSSQRLATLVKDLLAMSRIEGNRIVLAPKYFDLGALVNEQIMTIMPRATETGLNLTLKGMPQGELKAYADPEKVTQVFINLVSNGLKYTKKGGVTVSVADHNTHWEVAVTDTGIGLTPEDRQHLFEKFYRVQNDSTMGITGTGLGLYISKSLITMMGGDITVESTPGQGSTFAFTVAKKPIQVEK